MVVFSYPPIDPVNFNLIIVGTALRNLSSQSSPPPSTKPSSTSIPTPSTAATSLLSPSMISLPRTPSPLPHPLTLTTLLSSTLSTNPFAPMRKPQPTMNSRFLVKIQHRFGRSKGNVMHEQDDRSVDEIGRDAIFGVQRN
ncbi:hypothetical protein GmHk_20G059303 [Glycine max]|nr:hypothetical protein GmHk_20G059303 [Glycine max]